MSLANVSSVAVEAGNLVGTDRANGRGSFPLFLIAWVVYELVCPFCESPALVTRHGRLGVKKDSQHLRNVLVSIVRLHAAAGLKPSGGRRPDAGVFHRF